MFLQIKWEKRRVYFFNFQGRSFVIACYILYLGLYLENKGNLQRNKKYYFFFFIIGIFKKENKIFITF